MRQDAISHQGPDRLPADAPYGGAQFAYEQAGRRFNQFSQNVTRLADDGKSVAEAKQELYDEVTANFRAFLADRRPGQPFCYWFGPTNVHRTWIQGSGQALWGLDPDDLIGNSSSISGPTASPWVTRTGSTARIRPPPQN